jgi:hypothetical protein
MDGLIIKPYWLDLIFKNKSLEVRGQNCYSHIGKDIALIESGSGLIKGITNITHTFPIESEDYFKRMKSKHFIPTWNLVEYKTPWFWHFGKRYKLINPIPYKHPPGAVIWVKDVLI